MATRFYFDYSYDWQSSPSAPFIGPAADAGWEVSASRLSVTYRLIPKTMVSSLVGVTTDGAVSINITTTQDYLARQFVSPPITAGGPIAGTFSLVTRVSENVATTNASLAVSVRLISYDMQTVRGTLYTNFNADTEFPVAGSDATRIVNAGTITPVTAYPGDRIVVEIGMHATAPTTSGTAIFSVGNNAASDFALTTALTTNLNPWCEFSQNLFDTTHRNNRGTRPHPFSPGLAR
jgi:hypothetical protein